MSTAEQFDDSLLPSLSLAEAEAADLEQARSDMRREQEWLDGLERYATNRAVGEAYRRGELEFVGETRHFRPVATLREPANHDVYQPYLKAGAVHVLEALGILAHQNLRLAGVHEDIRFPITSMVRSMERQAFLAAQPGRLALPPDESGHSTGWDVDVDSSSYYLREGDEWKSVSRRNPEQQAEIARERARRLGHIALPTEFAPAERYDGRVRVALHEAVALLFAAGELSPVVEFVNTSNELIHLGIRPRN